VNRYRRFVLPGAVVLVLAAVALVAFASGDDDTAESGGIELAGMRMSDAELRELSRDSMGAELDDVVVATAADAARVDSGTLRGNVRTFELEPEPVRWEYRDGQRVAAWAYDRSVPGPTLRATEGERVRVVVKNGLPVATTVHWHGVDVPWRQDGIPGVTQEAIEPGESMTYEFVATPAGTRWYHTHGAALGEEASQLDMGLSGALLIEPRSAARAKVDIDETFVLDDWLIGAGGSNAAMMTGAGHGAHSTNYNVFTINGQAAPDVPDIVVRRGDRVRLRFVNASTMSYHPMHLHGHQFEVVALDGNPLDDPVRRNVVLLAPGETADVEFVANNPGVWMLHCHDLHHADAGMHQMLRYEGYEPVGGGEHGEESH
jgi:FtsP/CotA-like multicopper oxidase with cupredoxin domain